MQQLNDIKTNILSVIGDGQILFIIPPFGSINDIPLGPHILQALAKANGYATDILYLNILLASVLGVEQYEKIYFAPEFWMLGERLFARSAYDLPPLGKHPERCADEAMAISGSKTHAKLFYDVPRHFDLNWYLETEQMCQVFLDEAIVTITSLNYKMIGCTAMMWQTNCGIALLTGIKKHCPEIITLMGGSNCEGEMAEGIASLSDAIDYIFSGEGETAFLNFLEAYSAQNLPPQRIIQGEPLSELDHIPFPDYDICFQQYARYLGEHVLNSIKIWYETSRGCWWGQHSKCTFCGVPQITYRQKSVTKVIHDLKRSRESYPDNMLFMADSIMPRSYHKELLPIISKKEEFPSLAYSLRATLDLEDLINLKDAKITAIFPGIESFSANLLKLMHKGSTSRQNLLFLRNARSVGVYCDWFLLWGFPGDRIADYEDLLHLLPCIRHLQAPRKFEPMQLARFSPYCNNPREYNLTRIRPWAVFEMIYPEWADKEKLARYYMAEYSCEAYEHPEIIQTIANEIVLWKKTWRRSRLVMESFMNAYVIYDNRDLHEQEKTHVLEYQQAKEIMTSQVYNESEHLQWAVAEKLGVVLDSWYVPLVTASPELLVEFEERHYNGLRI